MKWHTVLIVLAVLILSALAPVVVSADSPTPAQYAMIHCSGLGIDLIVSGEQSFDTAFGYAHNLPSGDTPEGKAAWEGSYTDRTNQFARLLGCGDVLASGGQGAALTLTGKTYGPLYRAILKHEALP